MELAGRVVVVTGGASGIGRALCVRAAEEGAAGVVVADIDRPGAEDAVAAVARAAPAVRAVAVATDVSREADVGHLVELVEREVGAIDLYCSNAGIAVAGGVEVDDRDWDRSWRVNVLSHVYAARALLPRMVARRGGHLVITASAAGLLTNLGSAPYSATKHAAVALAEWLAITHAHEGVGVSCLCPQGVRTPLLERGVAADERAATSVLASGAVIEPEAVATAVVEALRERRFLVLPHPEVAEYARHRAEDPERWLRGMQRLWDRYRD